MENMAFGCCYAMWPFIAILVKIFIKNKKLKKEQNQNKGQRDNKIILFFLVDFLCSLSFIYPLFVPFTFEQHKSTCGHY